ncbi:MAG: NDP-sugar synthase [Elusimicrobia bacterium]|nr:NDP-sugar synthase [Elusimicrobiota bacterium]
MKVGILAAGQGERFKAAGLELPKPLIEVGGQPLIQRTLRTLLETGADQMVCIVNEEDSKVVRAFVASRFPSLPIQWLTLTTPSSMHSLFAVQSFMGGEPFLATTVDTVCEPRVVKDFFQEANRLVSRGAGSLGGRAEARKASDGILDDGTVCRASLTPPQAALPRLQPEEGFGMSSTHPPAWVTSGLYLFGPRVFRERDAALERSPAALRTFLHLLVERGYRVYGVRIPASVDVDRPEDIQVAERLLTQTQERDAQPVESLLG